MRLNTSATGGIEQGKSVLRQFPTWIRQSIFKAFCSETLDSMGCLPEFVGLMAEETTDEFDALQLHVQFLLKFVKHVFRFRQYHQTIPFCCNVFLDLSTSTDKELAMEVLESMKSEWKFILSEEGKHSKFLNDIHFLRWQAFREIHIMAEEESYKLTPRFIALVRAYLPGRQNTVAVEHTFGHLRDCETRHSKHKQGANCQIAATAVRTTNSMFGEVAKVVEVSANQVSAVPASFSQAVLKKDCLSPCKTPLGECGLLNAADIIKKAETRTSAFLMVQNNQPKLSAHQIAANRGCSTEYLWAAGIMPEGSVARLDKKE